MLCEYGCGQEAIFLLKFKSGKNKWCCSKEYRQCKNYRRKISEKTNGHKGSRKGETKENNEWLKWLSKQLTGRKLPKEVCDKISEGNKGKKISEESRRKQALSITGSGNYLYGKHRDEETKKKISNTMKEKCKGKRPTQQCIDASREVNRQRLLNGQSSYMNKLIKNPSKPEVMLRESIKKLYPTCEYQYQVLNYSIDIAIVNHKIAIEYDGWYHFDCKEHIEYHSKRQKEIENLGWKFIRYNIFQKFPTLEIILSDIKKKIEGDKDE